MVRDADPARDAAACAAIYAPFVDPGPASFEDEPPTAAEMASRIAAASVPHAWLVCERDGAVAGFAYATAHRSRAAYSWAAEVSVYVDAARARRGAGRELYGTLLPLLARRGLRQACAGITLPNAASVGLHEALGFEPVGVYRRIGWKAGAWRDVGWWQCDLAPEAGSDPPAGLAPG